MAPVRPDFESRLNVLLTQDRPQPEEHWTAQLGRLLEPQGVAAYVARTGQEVLDLVRRHEIHAAVVDLQTPLTPTIGQRLVHSDTLPHPGLQLLDILRRLPNRPPVVVVHGPALTRGEIDRLLQETLRLGVFSVLNKPVSLEQVLAVFRRMIDRQYSGAWPTARRATVRIQIIRHRRGPKPDETRH